MTKAAYFKGERLHENLQTWKAAPTSMLGRLQGAYRLMGKLNPRSRNRFTELTVLTAVRPKSDTTYMDRQTRLNAALHQKHDSLLASSETLGPVSWTDDDTQAADISSSYSANASPQIVSHGSLGGSWTPVVGHYLLCRRPQTDQTPCAGFVAAITAVGSGTVSFIVTEAIDSNWEIRAVAQHYPEMAYDTFADGGGTNPSVDFVRTGPKVGYRFVGGENSRIVIATALQQDLS